MQITFSGYLDIPDMEKWSAALREEIRKVFLKAAQKFLLAAVPRIPIFTGMARGALRNLEDLVGTVTSDAQSPTGVRIRTTTGKGTAGRGGGTRVGKFFKRGYYYYPPGASRVERTPQSGRQFATPTQNILDFPTGSSIAVGRSTFYFRYKIDITYFDILDKKKWESFKAAGEAFEKHVKNNIELPDPLKFTTRKAVK